MSGSTGRTDLVVEVEFPRPIDVTTLGKNGRSFDFQASATERTALARRYSVISLNSLMAQCDIVPVDKGCFRLRGSFTADVVQSCVISLEAVEAQVSGEFMLRAQRGAHDQFQDMTEYDIGDDEEDIEFFSSDIIDVGEIISQYLSLEINPFPRKAGTTGLELGQKILKEEDLDISVKIKNPFDLLTSLEHKS